MKRIKRKQLKEDEFVSTISRFIKYYTKHKQKIFVFLALFVFAVLIFFGVKILTSKKSQNESRILSEIFEIRDAIKTDPNKTAELEKLAGEGKFSRLAYIFLAAQSVENKDWSKAEEFLLKVPDRKKDLIYFQAQDLLGQVYADQEKWDSAIELYENLTRIDSKVYAEDVLLFHLAEIYEAKGEKEKALQMYKKISEEYPQTYSAYDASRKVSALEEAK
ncbi:MAG: tetratricopeptide repeat protein [Candidatus Aminicenantes bacterium]|nr:tetratricopeptide repeat protein [Candidatus Aminicenantes bacterium]